jgi:flagellar motor switch protein FliG
VKIRPRRFLEESCQGPSSKGLEVLQWMDARSIGEMIYDEHPQIIAIILSVLDYDVAGRRS